MNIGKWFWKFRVCAAKYLAPLIVLSLFTIGAVTWAQQNVPDILRLDGFDKSYPPGQSAPNWDTRKFAPLFGNGDVFFYEFVSHGPDEHYIHVRSGKNNSFSVGYSDPVPLMKLPWLEWDWKIGVLPKGGDVRVKERDDQAGSMCIIIDPHFTSFDSSLCYLFENDGPKDTPITSTRNGNARYLILRTAKAGDPIGEWLHERRNVIEDYKRVFGKAPGHPVFVGVTIDSNDTQSAAEAYYRNIVLRKEDN